MLNKSPFERVKILKKYVKEEVLKCFLKAPVYWLNFVILPVFWLKKCPFFFLVKLSLFGEIFVPVSKVIEMSIMFAAQTSQPLHPY